VLPKQYPKVLKVPCPKCKAGIGSMCLIKFIGGSKYRAVPHTERAEAAKIPMDKYERMENDY